MIPAGQVAAGAAMWRGARDPLSHGRFRRLMLAVPANWIGARFGGCLAAGTVLYIVYNKSMTRVS